MARLRLLIPLTLCAALLSACGPVWRKEIRGVIVDAESKEPIEGALVVYAIRSRDRKFFSISHWYPIGQSTTTTDAEGRFVFERKLVRLFHPWWWVAQLLDYPCCGYLDIAHEQYGWQMESSLTSTMDYKDLRLEFSKDGYRLTPDSEPCIWTEGVCSRICDTINWGTRTRPCR